MPVLDGNGFPSITLTLLAIMLLGIVKYYMIYHQILLKPVAD
jgi:hypothetical protein